MSTNEPSLDVTRMSGGAGQGSSRREFLARNALGIGSVAFSLSNAWDLSTPH